MKSWSDKYLLGIKEIDEQHRGFFELWDKELKNADMNDAMCLSCVIKKLEDYIKEHFSIEEEMMKNSGHKDTEKHIAMHRYFIQRVNEMKLELNYMNPLLFEKITFFMKKWFLNHIIQTDKQYKSDFADYNKDEDEIRLKD